MKNLIGFLLLVVVLASIYGCADMDTPTPGRILKHPLETNDLKLGMTKEEVISIYGNPTSKEMVKASGWEEPREEWFYSASYSGLPVLGVGHLNTDLYLYFDGDNLTKVSEKPLEKEYIK